MDIDDNEKENMFFGTKNNADGHIEGFNEINDMVSKSSQSVNDSVDSENDEIDINSKAAKHI